MKEHNPSLKRFFDIQLSQWPETRQRYDDLAHVQTKQFDAAGLTLMAQFNPARIRSTGANITKQALAHRPCFLCKENRPKEQISLETNGETSQFSNLKSHILVNPFPILPMHFTLPTQEHQPQRIKPLFGQMLWLLSEYPELTVFYNGPRCGASAPDHAHLQAGTTGILPLQREWNRLKNNLKPIVQTDESGLMALVADYPCTAIVIRTKDATSAEQLFSQLYDTLPVMEGEAEPMLNIVSWRDHDDFLIVVFPRKKHRPDCYYAEDNTQLLISPGALDMAGLLITPREEDFRKLTAEKAVDILQEVSMGYSPFVTVGIVRAQYIEFCLNGAYQANGETVSGPQLVECTSGAILWHGQLYNELRFTSLTSSFTLHDVIIGNGFHWERHQQQTFLGTLRLISEAGQIQAINELPVERYLESVIASEMSATSSMEFLKAHAVISRSWLFCQMQKRDEKREVRRENSRSDEHLRWYDREDHTLFDVCADDHCQRYQGIVQNRKHEVISAVQETRGQVLMYNDELCDTRFSKCCGGRTEEFQYCWEDTPKPYLKSVVCQWCDTKDKDILRQVLNDYDQETTDFHDWTVEYSADELTALVREKLLTDLGIITDLIPLSRGKSGRIWRLQIVGTKGSIIIGKELEIRRVLSRTHLYSSNFEVEKNGKFILHGHGWGHGVGLCQIGAAVMAHEGMTYRDILLHYYPGAEIKEIY